MKTKLLFMGVTITALSLFSCNQEDVYDISNEELNQPSVNNSARVSEGIIPFTVENVSQALPKVLDYYREHRPEVAERFANYKVEPTHVYYKFTPADSLQYSVLMENDNELQLTSDPFEFTPQERTEDPAENEIPSFYAVVSKEVGIPDVPHEKIALLHFTDEDKLEDAPHNYDEVEFKQNLMYETRKIAGHLDEEELAEGYMNYNEGIDERETHNNGGEMSTYGLFGKKWRPSGSVQVEDDYISDRRNRITFLPVKNCDVNVLKWGWLRVENGGTDANGNFSTGTTYTTHVHYNVKFTDFHKVKIRSGNFFDIANYKSDSHKRRVLDAKFTRNTKMQFYALVNNAAWDYFDRVVSTYQINNPQNIEISAHWEGNDKSNYYFGGIPFRSEVKVSRRKNGTYRGSDGVYAVVVHEMTHKGHYRMDNGAFGIFGGKKALFFRESWAKCVERQATNDKYQSLFNQYILGNYIASDLTGNQYSGHIIRTWGGDRQLRTAAEQNEYSEVLIDLMDDYNQSTRSTIYPVDNVSGYTLHQIQSAMNGKRTVDSFFDNLRSMYNNPTENNLQSIQDYANTIVNSL